MHTTCNFPQVWGEQRRRALKIAKSLATSQLCCRGLLSKTEMGRHKGGPRPYGRWSWLWPKWDTVDQQGYSHFSSDASRQETSRLQGQGHDGGQWGPPKQYWETTIPPPTSHLPLILSTVYMSKGWREAKTHTVRRESLSSVLLENKKWGRKIRKIFRKMKSVELLTNWVWGQIRSQGLMVPH